MNIEDIRSAFPSETRNKSDLDIVRDYAAVNKTSVEQMAFRLGVDLDERNPFLDLGVGAVAGVAQAAGSLVGLGSLVPGLNAVADPVSQSLNAGGDWVEKRGLSNYQQAKNAEMSQLMQSEEGFLDQMAAGGGYLWDNPSQALYMTAKSLPSMVAGGMAARGLQGLGMSSRLAAGALGEGAVITGGVASDIVKDNPDDFAARYYALPAGAGGAAIGYLGGRLLGRRAFDADQMFLRGATQEAADGSLNLLKPMYKRVPLGAANEAAEEFGQSVLEQSMTNLGTNRPWEQGTGVAGVFGAAAGGLMGAGGGLRRPGGTYTQVERDALVQLMNDPQVPYEERMKAAQVLQRIADEGRPVDLLQSVQRVEADKLRTEQDAFDAHAAPDFSQHPEVLAAREAQAGELTPEQVAVLDRVYANRANEFMANGTVPGTFLNGVASSLSGAQEAELARVRGEMSAGLAPGQSVDMFSGTPTNVAAPTPYDGPERRAAPRGNDGISRDLFTNNRAPVPYGADNNFRSTFAPATGRGAKRTDAINAIHTALADNRITPDQHAELTSALRQGARLPAIYKRLEGAINATQAAEAPLSALPQETRQGQPVSNPTRAEIARAKLERLIDTVVGGTEKSTQKIRRALRMWTGFEDGTSWTFEDMAEALGLKSAASVSHFLYGQDRKDGTRTEGALEKLAKLAKSQGLTYEEFRDALAQSGQLYSHADFRTEEEVSDLLTIEDDGEETAVRDDVDAENASMGELNSIGGTQSGTNQGTGTAEQRRLEKTATDFLYGTGQGTRKGKLRDAAPVPETMVDRIWREVFEENNPAPRASEESKQPKSHAKQVEAVREKQETGRKTSREVAEAAAKTLFETDVTRGETTVLDRVRTTWPDTDVSDIEAAVDEYNDGLPEGYPQFDELSFEGQVAYVNAFLQYRQDLMSGKKNAAQQFIRKHDAIVEEYLNARQAAKQAAQQPAGGGTAQNEKGDAGVSPEAGADGKGTAAGSRRGGLEDLEKLTRQDLIDKIAPLVEQAGHDVDAFRKAAARQSLAWLRATEANVDTYLFRVDPTVPEPETAAGEPPIPYTPLAPLSTAPTGAMAEALSVPQGEPVVEGSVAEGPKDTTPAPKRESTPEELAAARQLLGIKERKKPAHPALPQGATIEGEFTVVTDAEVAAATNLLENQKDAVKAQLTSEEKSRAAQHYGHKKWNGKTAEKFLSDYAAWLVDRAAHAAHALADVFTRLAKNAVNGFVAISMAFNFNVASVKDAEAKVPVTRYFVERAVNSPKADFQGANASADVRLVADWQLRKGHGKPFLIADKPNGLMYAFSADGKLLAKAPALYALYAGDVVSAESAAKAASEMTDADKVTPAGAFAATMEESAEYGTSINFVKQAKAVIAIHRVYLGNPKENRLGRLASATAADNRVSYGCVNVTNEFYDSVLAPNFNGASEVLVMPDVQTLNETFPDMAADMAPVVEERESGGSSSSADAVSWGDGKYGRPEKREDQRRQSAKRREKGDARRSKESLRKSYESRINDLIDEAAAIEGRLERSDGTAEDRARLQQVREQIQKLNKLRAEETALTGQLERGDIVGAIERVQKHLTNYQRTVYDALARGDVAGVLRAISKGDPKPQYRMLAKFMLKIGLNPKIGFGEASPGAIGTYYRDGHEIVIDDGHYIQDLIEPATRGGTLHAENLTSTVLHELVHAATVKTLSEAYDVFKRNQRPVVDTQALHKKLMRYGFGVNVHRYSWGRGTTVRIIDNKTGEPVTNFKNKLPEVRLTLDKLLVDTFGEYSADLTYTNVSIGPSAAEAAYMKTAQYQAAERIFKLFNHIRENSLFNTAYRGAHKEYGGFNPLEMVAEVFVDAAYQDNLASITVPARLRDGGPAKAFSWLAAQFKKLLGISTVTNSALEQLLRDGVRVFDASAPGEKSSGESDGYSLLRLLDREKRGGNVAGSNNIDKTADVASAVASIGKSAAMELVRKYGFGGVSLSDLKNLYVGTAIEGHVKNYVSRVKRIASQAKTYVNEGTKIIDQWVALEAADRLNLATALFTATLSRAWGNKSIDHEDNRHLTHRYAVVGKDGKHDWVPLEDADLVAEGVAAHRKAQQSWEALSPKAREIYAEIFELTRQRMKQEYILRANALRDVHLDALKALVTPEIFSKVSQAFHDVTRPMTATKREIRDLLKGNEKAIAKFRELNRAVDDQIGKLHELRGPYFPLMRFGEWFVTYKSSEFREAEAALKKLRDERTAFKAGNAALQRLDAAKREFATTAVNRSSSRTKMEQALKGRKELNKLRREADVVAANKQLAKMQAAITAQSKALNKMVSDPEHFEMSKHKWEWQAILAQKKYAGRPGKATHDEATHWVQQQATVGRGMLKNLEEALNSKLPTEVAAVARSTLNQVFVESMHDQSSLKHLFIRRKNVAGFDRDALRVFSSFVMQSSHRLSNMEHFVPMQDALGELVKTAQKEDHENDSKDHLRNGANQLLKRYEKDLQYTEQPFTNRVAAINHAYTLGITPAYLLQQGLQTPMITAPWLAGRYKLADVQERLTEAYGVGSAIMQLSVKEGGGWMHYALEIEKAVRAKLITADEGKMLSDLFSRGLLDIFAEHDVGDLAEGGSAAWQAMKKGMDYVNWPARQIETINRLTTALAAYRLHMHNQTIHGAKNDGGTPVHEHGVNYAGQVIEKTHIDYSNENAPLWLKSNAFPFAKLVTQFRKFQVAMAYTMVELAVKAWKGRGTTEGREELRKLKGVLASQLVMSGVMGLPGYNVAMMMLKLAGWDDPERDLKNLMAGSLVGDILLRGMPSAAGVSLTGSVGMGQLYSPLPYVRDQKTFRDSYDEYLLSVMGPAVGLSRKMVGGLDDFGNGKYLDGATKVLPRWLAGLIKAEKLRTEGLTDKSGNIRIPASEFNEMSLFAQAMGIPLLETSKYYERVGDYYQLKTERDSERQQLIRDALDGNRDTNAINEFNRKYPDHRITWKTINDARRARVKYGKKINAQGLHVSKSDRSIASQIQY